MSDFWHWLLTNFRPTARQETARRLFLRECTTLLYNELNLVHAQAQVEHSRARLEVLKETLEKSDA